MYFKVFISKSWGKRSVSCRRRFNQCFLKEKLYEIAEALPAEQRQIVQAYILARNDLDVETLIAALRWGKQHYK